MTAVHRISEPEDTLSTIYPNLITLLMKNQSIQNGAPPPLDPAEKDSQSPGVSAASQCNWNQTQGIVIWASPRTRSWLSPFIPDMWHSAWNMVGWQ